MKIEETFIKDCFVIKPTVYTDERGFFFESFNKEKFENLSGLKTNFVQDNQSFSTKGVLRGLHFQLGEHAQAKLVRVVMGEVLDIAVDLRVNSDTYGKHYSIILNDKHNYQLYIPKGFAHGFITLSEKAIFNYKCDNYYCKSAESGIVYNDLNLNINWKLPESEIIISEKDMVLPFFNEIIRK